MKKYTCYLCAAVIAVCVLFSGCGKSGQNNSGPAGQGGNSSLGSRTLVAQPLDSEEILDESSNKIQLISEYAGEMLEYSGPSTSGTNVWYNLTGDSEGYDVVKDYVDLLCSGDMNLDLVDAYENDLKTIFFSYALDYTGTANVSGNNEMQFNEDVICDICIWGTIERDRLEVRIVVPKSMAAVDVGYW